MNDNLEQIKPAVMSYINDDVSIFDALVYYAERHGMEVETVGKAAKRDRELKALMDAHAQKFNLLLESKSVFD